MSTKRLTNDELEAMRKLAAKNILSSEEPLRQAGAVPRLINEIERLRADSWLGEAA